MSHPSADGTSVALSRTLTDLLIELSIALHNHAIYPPRHPLAAVAAQRVLDRLTHMLDDRPTLSLGVARHQLVIEGVLTDPDHPLLRELALRFHRRQLGALRFDRGATLTEIGAFLEAFAPEPRDPNELLDFAALDVGPHVHIFPLSYAHLDLVDTARERAGDGGGSRFAQLWVGLARASLASSDLGAVAALGDAPADADAPPSDPVLVARAIDAHAREEAYDQVIVGYMVQMADELRVDSTPEARALQRRLSRLVTSLDHSTITDLLVMGGDARQRRDFALNVTQSLAVDAVVDIARGVAAAEGRVISQSMLRMLNKLAAHADGANATASEADAALRDNVRTLLSPWDLDNPIPADYQTALDGLSTTTAPMTDAPVAAAAPAERLMMMALELNSPAVVPRAVAAMLDAGDFAALLRVLDEGGDGVAARAAWASLCDPMTLARLVDRHLGDTPELTRVVQRAGAPAAVPLLDALQFADTRTARARLLDLLSHVGDAAVIEAIARMPDAPWYYHRNLLGVLLRARGLPPEFSALPSLAHDDARVRRAALKLAVTIPHERDRALLGALRDTDARVVHAALAALAEQCPAPIAAVLRHRVETGAFPTEQRALAVRAAGQTRNPETLQWLLGLAADLSVWYRPGRLSRKSPEQLGALSALRSHWRHHAGAAVVLALADRSSDAEVRSAAAGPLLVAS